jgi:HEAT repeat protein
MLHTRHKPASCALVVVEGKETAVMCGGMWWLRACLALAMAPGVVWADAGGDLAAAQALSAPGQPPRSMPSAESVGLEAAPGPRNWRPGIGSGVEFGLRMPRDPVVLGAPIPVEIHIRNGGAGPVDMALLGYEGDEPIPPCKFSVPRAASALIPPGRLAEKATATSRTRTLQPQEAVVFTVSLDSWVVDGSTNNRGTFAFREPGVYWIECVWEHPGVPPARAAGKLEFIRPGQLPEKPPDPKRLSRSTGSVPGVQRMPDYEVTYENLAQMLRSPNYRERYSAAVHLMDTRNRGWKGSTEEADALASLALQDAYWAVRYEGAKFAYSRGKEGAGMVPALVQALDSEEPRLRAQVALALERTGGVDQALPQLKTMLAGADQPLAATTALSATDAGRKVLHELAVSTNATVRLFSNAGLIKAGGDEAKAATEPYISDLQTALRSDNTATVIEACKSVDLAGGGAAGAGREMAALLAHSDPGVRNVAADAVLRVAPKDDAVVAALIEALDDKDIRHKCIITLGRIGDKARPAIPALIRLMERDSSMRYGVIRAFAGIDPQSPEVMAALLNVLKASVEEGRPLEEAIIALGGYGPAAKAAVPDLIKAMGVKGNHPYYLPAAIWALGQIGPDAIAARPELEEYAKGPFGDLAKAALMRTTAQNPATMPALQPKYPGPGLFF